MFIKTILDKGPYRVTFNDVGDVEDSKFSRLKKFFFLNSKTILSILTTSFVVWRDRRVLIALQNLQFPSFFRKWRVAKSQYCKRNYNQ